MLPESLAGASCVYHGVRFDVYELEGTKPDGTAWRKQVVSHPGAVVVLPLLDERPGREMVAMIRNERFAVGKTLWELPAGTLEPGEPPARCAARELTEETGYEASTIEALTDFYTSPGICTERMWAFVATDLSQVGQNLDPTERITVEVLGLDRTMQLLAQGQVQDAKTIATLLYYRTFGRKSEIRNSKSDGLGSCAAD